MEVAGACDGLSPGPAATHVVHEAAWGPVCCWLSLWGSRSVSGSLTLCLQFEFGLEEVAPDRSACCGPEASLLPLLLSLRAGLFSAGKALFQP